MFKPNLSSGWKTATSCIYRAGFVSFMIWATGKFQPINWSHELCPQFLASFRNWEEPKLRKTKLGKPWKVPASYSIQTTAFARLLALVGLPHVRQLEQLASVQLSCAMSTLYEVSLQLVSKSDGLWIVRHLCVHMEHLCAAAQRMQRKPEVFGGTLIVMASINCVEQDMKWVICNSH